jgi:hypothetical protein
MAGPRQGDTHERVEDELGFFEIPTLGRLFVRRRVGEPMR